MTSIKPDERVDVGVATDDRWRTLYGEPRPPRAIEDAFAAAADHRRRTTLATSSRNALPRSAKRSAGSN